MSTGWGAARSCRLLVVVLLALVIPLAAVVMDGDRWLAGPVDLSGGADRLVDLAAGPPAASAAGQVPWPRSSLATGVAANDVAAGAWTGLTSTDRAPPVSTPWLAQSAHNRSTIPHTRRM
jgi:hypothetical protein